MFGSIDAGSSQSSWFWFDELWIVVVSVVLFRLTMDHHSQHGFVPVIAGSS